VVFCSAKKQQGHSERVKLNKENTLTLDDEIKDTSLRYAPVPGIQSIAKQRRKS
jgi:hypothetical protein